MKAEKIMMKSPVGSAFNLQIHDAAFRIILIPALGIAIPLLAHAMDGSRLHGWNLKLSFLYTILIAGVVWEGNRYLWFSLNAYFDWYNKPVRRLIALFVGLSAYTILVCLLLHIGWYKIFNHGIVDWSAVFVSIFIILVCVFFIAYTYETVYLVKLSGNEKIRNEQLERARSFAELEALKHQVDPHFIFNCLNTLSYLIGKNKARALRFNENLADVYRYILQNKSKDLVLLGEEIEFVQQYLSLLQDRFDDAIRFSLEVQEPHRYIIPPISLQMLVENAIKHNGFSRLSPLKITITQRGELLAVSNNRSLKERVNYSPGIGLKNLSERYDLLMKSQITITATESHFIVKLPLKKA